MKSLTPIFILCLSVAVEAVADAPLEKVSGGMALEWASPSADDPLLALVPATVRDRVVVATIPGEGPLPDFNGGFGQVPDCVNSLQKPRLSVPKVGTQT